MKPPKMGARRAVFNKRNSEFNVPLEWLDQANWWQDSWHTDHGRYLHVQGLASADPTGEYGVGERVFRVYPRKLKGRLSPVTLALHDGVLFWIYGATPEEKAKWDAYWDATEAAKL